MSLEAPRGRYSPASLVLVLVLGLTSLTSLLAHEPVADEIAGATRRLSENPDRADLYLRRAELLRVDGEPALAFHDLRRARELDPALALVDLALGRLLLDEGRAAEAHASLDTFLRCRPDHVEALTLRARAAAATGRPLDAALDDRRAIELHGREDPPRPEAYLALAGDFEAAGIEYRDLAMAALEEGIAALGPVASLELAALEREIGWGRPGRALGRLQAIVEVAPRKEPWLVRIAVVHESLGRAADARAAYQQALRLIERLPPERRRVALVEELRRAAVDGLERLDRASDGRDAR